MKLFVMRHGEAVGMAVSDAERPLSRTGQQEVCKVAALLKGIPLKGVLCSPYLRAQQTAALVQEVIGSPDTTLTHTITPDASPESALCNLPEEGNWLLVAHMPLVGRLTGLLVDGSASSGPFYQTAMVVELDMEYPGSAMATQRRVLTP